MKAGLSLDRAFQETWTANAWAREPSNPKVLWSFEHDSAGRITAAVFPDGGRAELEYAANDEPVRTIVTLSRSTERVFDELGNVTASRTPAAEYTASIWPCSFQQ